MIFQSRLSELEKPHQDVFNYIFSHRREYSPDRVLFMTDDDQETLTLRQLEEKSRQFAYGLVTRYGIQPQDTVAILATDSVAYPIAYFGILAAGATAQLIPIQAELSTSEVVSRLAQAEARLLVTDSTNIIVAKKSTLKLGIPMLIQDCSCSSHELFGHGSPKYYGFQLRTEAGADSYAAFINRTSGSTGNMKSVITTHAHFIAALEATFLTVPSNTDGDHDVWLSSMSLGFFINAKLHMGLNILLGIPVVLMRKPFDYQNLGVIEKHRISFLFLPPPVAAGIAKGKTTSNANIDVSSIKWLLTAGAPMHEGLRQAVSSKLNNIHLTMEWASSETLLLAIQLEGRASVPGSSGTLVNGIEARVIDTATGRDLGPNEGGEILVRNKVCRYAGYKSNEEANKATFDSDGWFHSGDFGFLDEECNIFITDRLKELIRVGGGYGVHVSATEIEAILFDHPGVAQVVVTACPDPETTIDLPTAFVVLKPEYDQDRASALASIEDWASSKLSGLQRLSGGIIFVSRFPQVGFKINRRALKALVQPGLIDAGHLRYIEVRG